MTSAELSTNPTQAHDQSHKLSESKCCYKTRWFQLHESLLEGSYGRMHVGRFGSDDPSLMGRKTFSSPLTLL